MPIYGKVKLNNGITINWLKFIDSTNNTEEAETEAMRIVTAQHVHVKKCWITK